MGEGFAAGVAEGLADALEEDFEEDFEEPFDFAPDAVGTRTTDAPTDIKARQDKSRHVRLCFIPLIVRLDWSPVEIKFSRPEVDDARALIDLI